MTNQEMLKEIDRFEKALYPEIYEFDKDLVDDIGEILIPLQEKFEKSDKKNAYLNKVNKIQNRFYDSIIKNESKHLDKVNFDDFFKEKETKKDFSKKEKLQYYSKRVNNPKLTLGQQLYAKKRINELR